MKHMVVLTIVYCSKLLLRFCFMNKEFSGLFKKNMDLEGQFCRLSYYQFLHSIRFLLASAPVRSVESLGGI